MPAFFAVVELREYKGTGDYTMYVSNIGGSRTVSSTLQNFRKVATFGRLVEKFGNIQAPLETPSSLSIEIHNGDGFYDDLLPTGTNQQFFTGSKVTVYSGGAEGDNVTSMTKLFTGFIVDGSLRFSRSMISFEVQDHRLMHDAPIANKRFSEATNYDSGDAPDIGSQTIPVIIGNWTDQDITCYRIDGPESGSSDTIWKACDHKIGTVTVNVGGSPVTPSSTDYNNGEFTLSSAQWNGSDAVTVSCVGYPDECTDSNGVTIMKCLLTNFADTSIASLSYYTGGGVGDFDGAYDALGGASTGIKYRRYITSKVQLLQEIATLAKESMLLPWVEDEQYRVLLDTSLVFESSPAAAVEISERQVSTSQEPESEQDPTGNYANVGIVSYAPNPEGVPAQLFDSRVSLSGGIIGDSRTKYGQDVYWTDDYVYLYEGETILERQMFNRASNEVYENLVLTENELSGAVWSLGLAQEIDVDYWRLSGKRLRIVTSEKNLETLRVSIKARNMASLPVLYRWTDASGQIDGITQTGNTWRSDIDTSGGLWA